MTQPLLHPPKASPGDRIAVLSPSFAAPDVVTDVISSYNDRAAVCVGVPFGRTRPQWVLPHGGEITVDGAQRRVFADYS